MRVCGSTLQHVFINVSVESILIFTAVTCVFLPHP